MATTDKDKVFTALEIRDTANHDSVGSMTGEFTAETIVVHNSLNQDCELQLQGSADDGANWIDIGDSFTIPANTNDYQTVTDYFCCYRLQAQCSVAPTTGSLTSWILKTHGS